MLKEETAIINNPKLNKLILEEIFFEIKINLTELKSIKATI